MYRTVIFLLLCAAVLAPRLAMAEDDKYAAKTSLADVLTPELLAMVFPGADRYGDVEGVPPAAAVYQGETLVGYVFETFDVVQGVGFSRKPFHIVVGLGLDDNVKGVRLVHHGEPIAILGRTDDDFHQYLTQFPGLNMRDGVSVVIAMSDAILEGASFAQRTAGTDYEPAKVDAVSRTTTSSVLFSDAIVRAARVIARSRGFAAIASPTGKTVDRDTFEEADWQAMLDDGSIAHLNLTHGDLIAAFAEIGAEPPEDVRSWKEEQTFLDLYVALTTPPGIGRNILERTWHDQYTAAREIDDLHILVMAESPSYSVRAIADQASGIFDRIRVIQGDQTFPLTAERNKGLPFLHVRGGPEFLTEIDLFFFTKALGFDPAAPWRLELVVEGESAAAGEPGGMVAFPLPYQVPERFVIDAPLPELEPVALADTPLPAAATADDGAATFETEGVNWRQQWQTNRTKVIILGVTLAALALILSLQEVVARWPWLHTAVRVGFLAWTLGWIGWYAGAQLTIINLLNIAISAVEGFDWSLYLVEPLIFMIGGFVLVGLFLWGRAIFCGWLCPFGALQELLNKLAQRLRLPQITVPHLIQERLFAVKYVIFLSLVGLAFYDFDLAIQGTTVEPFKTAITFRFDAPWAAVTYALVLLGIGLFIERFYCRFICPLGAGLAILGRVRMFNWLKRRTECGSPCKVCESVCPVGAIKRSGEIDMNECFYCLDCQVTYYDDHACPPLIKQRKRLDALAPGTKAPALTEQAAE